MKLFPSFKNLIGSPSPVVEESPPSPAVVFDLTKPEGVLDYVFSLDDNHAYPPLGEIHEGWIAGVEPEKLGRFFTDLQVNFVLDYLEQENPLSKVLLPMGSLVLTNEDGTTFKFKFGHTWIKKYQIDKDSFGRLLKGEPKQNNPLLLVISFEKTPAFLELMLPLFQAFCKKTGGSPQDWREFRTFCNQYAKVNGLLVEYWWYRKHQQQSAPKSAPKTAATTQEPGLNNNAMAPNRKGTVRFAFDAKPAPNHADAKKPAPNHADANNDAMAPNRKGTVGFAFDAKPAPNHADAKKPAPKHADAAKPTASPFATVNSPKTHCQDEENTDPLAPTRKVRFAMDNATSPFAVPSTPRPKKDNDDDSVELTPPLLGVEAVAWYKHQALSSKKRYIETRSTNTMLAEANTNLAEAHLKSSEAQLVIAGAMDKLADAFVVISTPSKAPPTPLRDVSPTPRKKPPPTMKTLPIPVQVPTTPQKTRPVPVQVPPSTSTTKKTLSVQMAAPFKEGDVVRIIAGKEYLGKVGVIYHVKPGGVPTYMVKVNGISTKSYKKASSLQLEP